MHQPVVGHGHQDGAEEEVDGSALCLMCGFFHQSGKQMVLFYICMFYKFFFSLFSVFQSRCFVDNSAYYLLVLLC